MKVESLKGIGSSTLKLLNELNIYTVNDLISYYPFRYNILQITNITDNLAKEDTIVIKCSILTDAKVFYIRKNLNRLTFTANTNNKIIKVVIFNRAFLKQNLTVGKNIILIGKYDKLKNQFVASDIRLKDIEDKKIEPIYHLINGLKYHNLCKFINEALTTNILIDDYIPSYLIKKYHFLNKVKALNEIHQPKSIELLKKARLRLIYEELFVFMFKVLLLKQNKNKILKPSKDFNEKELTNIIDSLPFELTDHQLQSLKDILKDLKKPIRMNRILIGDVGSGKTIVAFLAMYANYLSGYQSVLMAPTEVLATQHYENLKKILKDKNVNLALLTGSIKPKDKEFLKQKIANNEINIVIGTHALFTKDVTFANLGLVVTDEQHRFGVEQRSTMHQKGSSVDILYMSATPIPRTYALTIYGDLDVSTIKTKPTGRKSIITKNFKEQDLKIVLQKIYEQIKNKHQIYVVCPIIETNEELDLKGVEELKQKFLMAFNHKIRVEILHSRMNNEQKDKIMNDFKNGHINILVSTTVIEVGVDVANATMMVIFNAERFGLSTLHQLRGRVGRNDEQSYCYLISNKDTERLKILEESNDGFYISEKDLELRGHGDLFGIKQSGEMNFKIANITKDFKVLMQAKKDCEVFIQKKYYEDYEIYGKIIKDIEFID